METTEPKITINVPEGTTEFTIREGQALPVINPRKVILIGTIDSPRKFAEKRKIDITKALVTIEDNSEKSEIKLLCDETDLHSNEITGKIEIHPALKELPVNNDKTFTLENFRTWVRKNAHVFSTADEHLALTGSLIKFKGKIEKIHESEKDHQKGNSKDLLQTTITSDMKESFSVTIPILKGGNKETFKVDICADAQGNAVIFFLESNDLKKLLIDKVEAQINEEKKYFSDNNYCIIYKTN